MYSLRTEPSKKVQTIAMVTLRSIAADKVNKNQRGTEIVKLNSTEEIIIFYLEKLKF